MKSGPNMKDRPLLAALVLALAGTALFLVLRPAPPAPPPAKPPATAPAYEDYAYGAAGEKVIDIGTLPTALYSSFTTEALLRDRVLRQQLAAEGWVLREHPYRDGMDMIPYSDGRLDIMTMGDISAFIAMQTHNLGIFAVSRQGLNAVIANRRITMPDLRGQRIGYAVKPLPTSPSSTPSMPWAFR